MSGLSDGAVDRLMRIEPPSTVSDNPLPGLDGTRYEWIDPDRPLGHGGMATVYRVRDRLLDREVALKVLNTHLLDGATSAEAARRMEREARIVGRLEHPGIVPIHDFGRLADGRVFYVMKRVRGDRLDRWLDTPRSQVERLGLFERLCEAVAFAHAQGVVHRDLKPENIMVGSFGEVLVMDWGVAKVPAEDDAPSHAESSDADAPEAMTTAWSPDSRDTAHGTILGTPGFMAPEQARGDVDRIDGRADVFALGAILRFLTGSEPSRRGRRLAAIAQRAMAARPAGRYQGVEQLSAEIVRFRAGDPIEAYRERWWEKMERFLFKFRVPILLVVAYLLMRIVLFVIAGL